MSSQNAIHIRDSMEQELAKKIMNRLGRHLKKEGSTAGAIREIMRREEADEFVHNLLELLDFTINPIPDQKPGPVTRIKPVPI